MFAVRANHAFDGEDFRAGGAAVLVKDGGMVRVEPVGYAPPSDCELLDYGNATVLPGLIDSHVRNADAMNIAAKQASSMAGAHRSRTGGSAAAATEWRRRGRAAEDFGSRGTGDEGSTGEEPDLVQHVRPKTPGAEGTKDVVPGRA